MAAAILAAVSLHAAATGVVANQTDQAPGFFRAAVGDYTVTALYDGYVDLDPKLLKGMSEEDIQARLARNFKESDNGMQTAVNGFLIHTGQNLVLVDAGAGGVSGQLSGILAPIYRPQAINPKISTQF